MNFVENRLRQFAEVLPGIGAQGYEIDFFGPAQTNEGFQLLLHFRNGSSSLLQDLPAGYRRLYSIVFDMAYRSYILNGDKEPVGVAIIDEIDLHLHPELEKDVLNVFHQTFPNIQFIVSTHSPMVLTNLQNSEDECRIMRMEMGDDYPIIINDIYGLDYNTGVEDVMGVEARNVEIDNLLDTLAYYVDNNIGEQAQNVRSLLLKKLNGNESRLNELLAKRIEEMGDEIHR
jgi:predicted ATP-binding protein involved in virulence